MYMNDFDQTEAKINIYNLLSTNRYIPKMKLVWTTNRTESLLERTTYIFHLAQRDEEAMSFIAHILPARHGIRDYECEMRVGMMGRAECG